MYRIVSDYGYGDKTWLERGLTKDEVIQWFIVHKNYSKDITFEDCPNDSDFTYYYEKDNENDIIDWDWQDS
jgi:hypothetical protein